MINGRPLSSDAIQRRARVYRAGSCRVCRHEPLAGGCRKVIWTEADRPEELRAEIEPCPFISCPHGAAEGAKLPQSNGHT